jgi:hypothetical protein
MISTHQKEPDATDIYVGKRVRMRRLALDMSQTNLADALGSFHGLLRVRFSLSLNPIGLFYVIGCLV